jgi:hypothetical protein
MELEGDNGALLVPELQVADVFFGYGWSRRSAAHLLFSADR